jgi:hypothetical protein
MTGLLAWIGLVVLAVGFSVGVALIMRRPMLGLLTANTCLAPAARFYWRAFVLVVLLAALAAAAGTGLPCEKQAENTMTLVWWTAAHIQPMWWSVAGFLMAFVLLLTILFAVLGRYRDQ